MLDLTHPIIKQYIFLASPLCLIIIAEYKQAEKSQNIPSCISDCKESFENQ